MKALPRQRRADKWNSIPSLGGNGHRNRDACFPTAAALLIYCGPKFGAESDDRGGAVGTRSLAVRSIASRKDTFVLFFFLWATFSGYGQRVAETNPRPKAEILLAAAAAFGALMASYVPQLTVTICYYIFQNVPALAGGKDTTTESSVYVRIPFLINRSAPGYLASDLQFARQKRIGHDGTNSWQALWASSWLTGEIPWYFITFLVVNCNS